MAEKLKILAVDDDPLILTLLTDMLTPANELQISKSAKEAMKLMEKTTPDLILLDIAMADISGFKFLEIIKKKEKFKDIPVIVVSGYIETEFIMYAESLGVKGTVGKPIKKDELLRKIDIAVTPR